jgi:hypothetical protein
MVGGETGRTGSASKPWISRASRQAALSLCRQEEHQHHNQRDRGHEHGRRKNV